jgi:hypothetical protein
VVVLAGLTWALPLSLAGKGSSEKDKDQKGLAQRVAEAGEVVKKDETQ